jgi:hypothetical protein
VTGASSRRTQSLRGHTSLPRQRTSHGITRRRCTRREGFAVMSGCAHGVTSVQGSSALPDKEFRYLRTVIVTAAVYRGLVSELRLAANPST